MILNRDAKNKLTWQESDAKYIARGRAMAIQYHTAWDEELAQMNHHKRGRPYKYPNSMMTYIALNRSMMNISYRTCEGQLIESWGTSHAPDFSTIWKRIGKTMPKFERDTTFSLKEGALRVVIDATGMKTANRSEWIRAHWNVKRGFFKLHLMVDLDTRRILAFALTDMNGGDASLLPTLLNDLMKKYTGEGIPIQDPVADLILEQIPARASTRTDSNQTLMDRWISEDKDTSSDSTEIVVNKEELLQIESIMGRKIERIRKKLAKKGVHIELRGDGGYDAKYVFSLLSALGIIPVIRIRVNANAQTGGVGHARALAVLEQLGGRGGCTSTELNHMTKKERKANQKDWKKDVRYGLRWIVEIVISAFKRVFGESVRALKPYTVFVEITTKIAAYNRNLDIGDAAVKAMRNHPNTGPPQNEWV